MSVAIVIGVRFFRGTGRARADPVLAPAGMGGGAIFSAFLRRWRRALGVRRWEDLIWSFRSGKTAEDFPRALVGGVGFVAVVYLLFSALAESIAVR